MKKKNTLGIIGAFILVGAVLLAIIKMMAPIFIYGGLLAGLVLLGVGFYYQKKNLVDAKKMFIYSILCFAIMLTGIWSNSVLNESTQDDSLFELDSDQIAVNNDGTLQIKGKAKQGTTFYLNDKIVTATNNGNDTFFINLKMSEPIEKAILSANYMGKGIGEKEITFDTTSLAESSEDKKNIQTASTETARAQSSSSSSEDSTKKDDYESVNKQIAEHLDNNKGWAMGTIDENGNPIENGETNSDYMPWIYVTRITYDGTGVDVETTADFQNLTESEKSLIASSAQGMTMAYSGITSHPYVTVRNGSTIYGESKTFNTSEFKWK